jgi:hypothetical protein
VRSNVLQPAAAAFAAACIAVPACVPAVQVAAHRVVPAIESHSSSLPVALSASTTDLLNALGLFVEVPLWLTAANPTGASPTATSVPPLPTALKPGGTYDITSYSSAFTVINAAIKIISAPAVDLTTGQFGNIPTDVQNAVKAFRVALMNLAPSIKATLQYAVAQFVGLLNGSTTANAPKSAAEVSALAAAPKTTATAPDLSSVLDALGLVLVRVPLWLTAANPTGVTPAATNVPPLPKELSALTPYASVFTVLNAAIKIISAPAVDLTTGQFGNIPTDLQNAVKAFQKVASNYGNSVTATLQYAANQVAADLGMAPAQTTAQKKLSITAAAVKTNTTVTDSSVTDTSDVATLKPATPKALPAATSKTATPKTPAAHGFLSQLQGAVDNQVGGSKVNVSGTGAVAGSSTSSTGSTAPKHSTAGKAHAAAKGAAKSNK